MPWAGSIVSGEKQRHVPSGHAGTIQSRCAPIGPVSSHGPFAIYPRIFTATNSMCDDFQVDRALVELLRPVGPCPGDDPGMVVAPCDRSSTNGLTSFGPRVPGPAHIAFQGRLVPRRRTNGRGVTPSHLHGPGGRLGGALPDPRPLVPTERRNGASIGSIRVNIMQYICLFALYSRRDGYTCHRTDSRIAVAGVRHRRGRCRPLRVGVCALRRGACARSPAA